MSAGRRDKLVTLQRRGSGVDAAGQQVETWATLRMDWASIAPVSGREYFNASGERSTVTHRIYVVPGSGVAPRDRVLFGSRIFDIDSVINISERGRELELMCTERIT